MESEAQHAAILRRGHAAQSRCIPRERFGGFAATLRQLRERMVGRSSNLGCARLDGAP